VVRFVFDQHIWGIGVVLALLSLACAGVIVQQSRREAVEHARADIRGLGIVLAEQTSRYVQTIDLVVQQAQSHIQDLEIRTPDAFRRLVEGEDTHRYLAEQAMSLPPGHGVDLFDTAGTLVNSSHPSPAPVNMADAAWFQHLRDHRDSEVVIGEVSARHTTGGKAFFIGRRISAPDGTFLGAAVAAIDIDDMHYFYTVMDNERRLSVTLRRDDGLVLMHYSATGGIEQTVPSTAAWFDLVAGGGGIYHAPDDPTVVRAIISINPTPRYPLALDVAVPEQDMLKAWHDQDLYLMVASGGFSALLLVSFGLIGRHLRQQKEQNVTLARYAATLRKSEARLRDFSEMASDWFWEQDADLRFVALTSDETLRARNRAKDKESPFGKLRWELNDTSRDPEHWDNHRRTLLAHQPFRDFSFDQMDENDRVRHVTISGAPMHDQNGTFTGYRGVGRDITAHIEAERNLKEAKEKAERAEALLQDAIDTIGEAFLICDAEDCHVLCNETYRRIYEYESGEQWVPGRTREDGLRRSLANSRFAEPAGRDPAWVDEWVRKNLEVPSWAERSLADGRWLLVTRQRMRSGGIAVLMVDITKLREAQSALRESEAKFHGVVNQSFAGIAVIEDGKFSYSNARFDEIFGYTTDEIRRLGPSDIAAIEDRDLVKEDMRQRLSGAKDRADSGFRGLRRDGTVIDIEVHGSVMETGGKRVLISLLLDVTDRVRITRELEALKERLREESIHDALTGLYNRRYLGDYLDRELIVAKRANHPVSVIMADIDHFKNVNDHHGHLAGDEVLRVFGDLMKRHARASDVCCRYGGEEFLLILPRMRQEIAVERAEQLRGALADIQILYGETPIAVTASFGVATFPGDGETTDTLLSAADKAMYAAKTEGRNRVNAAQCHRAMASR
jgi:diguanylate cyclase (GGDEF)-like protein/PAS domain S-box-containing protein